GADFEAVRADSASETFRRINRLAMVPALDIGGPRAMTQADAILAYIAEMHPDARLGPAPDAQGRIEFAESTWVLTRDFHPACWPLCAQRRFAKDHARHALDQVRAASHARIDRVMQHLDRLVGQGSHVYRERRTVADAYA